MVVSGATEMMEMAALTCNSCNKELIDDADQKLHYKSEWHRYNLKRKVAGVPGVTEALFLARQSALAAEKEQSASATPMLYSCVLCGKGYRSSRAHAQHLKSRSHITRASQGGNEGEDTATGRPLQPPVNKQPLQLQSHAIKEDSEEGEEEWESVDSEEDLRGEAIESLNHLNVNEIASNDVMDEDDDDDLLDPSCCFVCDREHDNIESCMVHMHKQHGFFIPDVEYLKDPEGLLTYLGLRVKKDFMCLYCNERCLPFNSLEAVRKHMVAKSHCRVHYGDGGDDEEAELEEFYDYSSSYVDEDGKQLVASGDMANTIELGSGGSELIINARSGNKISTKTLGSREFLRYYRQKPRPSALNSSAVSAALASRYRSMGLATVQTKQHMVKMKVMKAMNRSGVDFMRSKMGMKSNVIRNLPNNVPY